jgi:SNF2 family DNA or RNA helicase
VAVLTLPTNDDAHLLLQTSYSERDLAQQIAGCAWKKDLNAWTVPRSLAVCYTARALFGQRLEVHDDVQSWAREAQQREVRLRQLVADPLGLEFTGLDARPYQLLGKEFLAEAGRIAGGALLTDEQGTGKTRQAILSLQELGDDALPALIVCPKTLVRNWLNEFNLWAPQLRVVPITGGASQRSAAINQLAQAQVDEPAKVRRGVVVAPARVAGKRGADVGIIGWDSLSKHTRLQSYGSYALTENEKTPKELNIVVPRTVIGDEVHRVVNPKAVRTRAWWWVCDHARYKFGLTGTPIRSTPDDMWSLLRAVDKQSFPSKTKFLDRFCETHFNAFGGLEITGLRHDTEPELRRTLDIRMLRRTKEQVLPMLPPKVWETRYVELPTKARKAYEEFKNNLVTTLDGGAQLIGFNQLTSLARLVQLAAATVVPGASDNEYLLAEPSWKIDALLELLEDLGNEPLVVFAMSRQLIDLAAARLDKEDIENFVLTGSTPDEDRAKNVAAFQAGERRVFLATLGAGGEGITLTRASNLCYLQRSWNLVEMRQSSDRVHRIGAEIHDSITLWDLISEDTVEDAILTRLDEKDFRFEEVVRDRQKLLATLR